MTHPDIIHWIVPIFPYIMENKRLPEAYLENSPPMSVRWIFSHSMELGRWESWDSRKMSYGYSPET